MNTPTHIVVSALLLGRGRLGTHWLATTIGAVLPDAPMFLFYLYQRVWAGRSEQLIWTELYFEREWQVFFDVFNGLPIIALGLAIAYWRRSTAAMAVFLSMGIHSAADFFVHREDAHGHLFPLTDWRFVSPVSYWDPAHHGLPMAALETMGLLVGCVLLIRRGGPWRAVGLTCGVAFVFYAAYVVSVFLGPSS